MADPVVTLAGDLAELRNYLLRQSSPSFAATVEQVAPKVLLLASASLFEEQIIDHIQSFVDEVGGSVAISSLVRRKALARQYHSLFDWDNRRPGSFFSLFGEPCSRELKAKAGTEPLSSSLAAFLELGALRNQLVHRNYAAFVLEKTTDEVLELYVRASVFVNSVPSLLRSADAAAAS